MKIQKINKNLAIALVAIIITGTQLSYGQSPQNKQQNYAVQKQGRGRGNCLNNLNLSETQKSEIDKLKFEHKKKMLVLKTSLMEKKAHFNTLKIQEFPDMKAINTTIDEMSSIKNKMMKTNIAHKMAIRALLDEEQKVIFNEHQIAYGGKGHKNAHGYGNGYGNSKKSANCRSFNGSTL